ncbi:hypothetical protein D0502_02240 [Leuconostoc falkenbergense]|uniref:Uncharacterized protein n=1 Tax=Leuconostoc falkenbergense TaxID=2766470 RepID=A0A9X3E6B7_9LACO|nr:hypothetical protein [Leuconostoc falkenbergense]MCX7578219.1 hypothetical protein [Leuconostoc falkenbergense]
MNKTVTKAYEQVVNDDNGILVADFHAQFGNGSISNLSIAINTVEAYQANKDKVATAFDDFLVAIQKDNLPVVSLDNVESTADSETASAEVLSSESESVVTGESESESQSESASTLESQSNVSQSDSDSQSESESETDITSDSTSDSTSALSQ